MLWARIANAPAWVQTTDPVIQRDDGTSCQRRSQFASAPISSPAGFYFLPNSTQPIQSRPDAQKFVIYRVIVPVARADGAVGLLRIDDVTADRIDRFGSNDSVVLLGAGSLGLRATMFDWHAVFAVDPSDAGHVIAPDITTGMLRELNRGVWQPLPSLTELATGNAYRLYGGDRTEWKSRSSSPYRPDRVWIATRDNGLFIRDARGERKVRDSELIKYITTLATTPGDITYIASYGRGL